MVAVENIPTYFLSRLEHVEVGILNYRICIFINNESSYRYAEKIFWSIEALRNEEEEAREEALENVTAPRIVEFYFFLQAFVQSLPQILLQVHILMRFALDMKLETSRYKFRSQIKYSKYTRLFDNPRSTWFSFRVELLRWP